MPILAVIPARYASTRLPGKPLALIAGKPMIEHVWRRCSTARGIDRVIVATDDDRIATAVKQWGGEAELTSERHLSGTDRVAEVSARHREYDIVLNVQGDEPVINPETISGVALSLRDRSRQISTAISPIRNAEDLDNPNVVKVVTAMNGSALYFSRSAIPYHRDGRPETRAKCYRHQGIYGFQSDIVAQVTKLTPSPLEISESLEQLRWLQANFHIHCEVVSDYSIGVDTIADLQAAEQLLKITG